MDFFAQQEKARKKTKLLVFYFAVAVILLIAFAYFTAWFFSESGFLRHHGYYHTVDEQPQTLWDLQIFLFATIGTLAVISIGCAYKMNELAGGGSALAESLGGKLVKSHTADPNERKLLNVVEEMAIASGVPIPQVYVLDGEQSINAFAAGHTPSDAVIGVTRGCIEMLSRDQLQGVIGHEFSHLLNGDMRLNIRLIGILFGIFCLATIGRILLSARTGNNRNNAVPLIGFALLILGSVGVFFGRLIQAAVSRQREFLADASSVQFTRNPLGLSGALQKIGRFEFGSHLESEHAPDASHMFFGNALAQPLFGALATHPPIPERIHAIDSSWDGKFPPLDKEQVEVVKRAALSEMKHPSSPMPNILGSILGGAVIASGSADKPPVIKSCHVLPNIGNPTPLHLEYAVKLRDALPENMKAAAREPLDAVALVYALLLSDDDKLRAAQIAEIGKRSSLSVSEKTAALFPDVSKIAAHVHLPIINLALGGLRQLSAEQFRNFSQTLQWLIESDGKVELFEFVLQKIVLRNLDSQFNSPQKSVVQFYTIKPLVPDCAVILSALANVGSDDAAEIEKAFETGTPYLRAPNDADVNLLRQENCGVNEIDAALNRLAQAVPIIKKNLIEACAHVVGADGVIVESEAELLRAISDTLDCPMPPFMPDAT
jgi:Zn-dependent protease with chaperone function